MSTKPAMQLNCDGGCGAFVLGLDRPAATAAAAATGWSVVYQIKADGTPSRHLVKDVCAACKPTFATPKIRSPFTGMSKRERRLITMLRFNGMLLSRQKRDRIKAELDTLAVARVVSDAETTAEVDPHLEQAAADPWSTR